VSKDGPHLVRFERIVRHPLAASPSSISKQNAMSTRMEASSIYRILV